MKKSSKLRKKTRRLIIKNLIVILTLAVIAFVGVFSWFKLDQEADASGVKVSTKAEYGLEYYIMPPSDRDQYADINTRLSNNETWNAANPTQTPLPTKWHEGEITFDFAEQEFKFMEGLFLCETTSDGTKFYIPKLFQSENIAYVDTNQNFDPAVANDEYMSYDIYFRSEASKSIAILNDSAITPNPDPSLAIANGTYNNISDNADNYKNAAVGAVRLSIQNMDGNDERELLWIPAPYIWYDGANDQLQYGITDYSNKGSRIWNISTESLISSTEGTNRHAYFACIGDSNTPTTRTTLPEDSVTASTGTGQNIGKLGKNKTILTLSNTVTESGKKYYYGHVRVNLWIEGEDSEARLALVNGKFNVSLHFDVVES